MVKIIAEIPIESGPALLPKYIVRLLPSLEDPQYRQAMEPYTVAELLCGMRLRRAPHVRHPLPAGRNWAYKGFSVWNLKQYLEAPFRILATVFPFSTLKYFNAQVVYVCTLYQADGANVWTEPGPGGAAVA